MDNNMLFQASIGICLIIIGFMEMHHKDQPSWLSVALMLVGLFNLLMLLLPSAPQ